MSAVKFTFDNDFDSNKKESIAPDSFIVEAHEMEKIRQDNYNKGVIAGEEQALASIAKQQEMLTATLITQLQALAAQHEEYLAIMQRDAARLAHAITSSLVPALVTSTPLPEIEMLVSQCLKNNPHEARIVVRVADDLLSALKDQIDHLKDAASFPGQIVLLSDPALQHSDCRVEWADGGAERDFGRLKESVDKTIDLFLGAVGGAKKTPAYDPSESSTELENSPFPA